MVSPTLVLAELVVNVVQLFFDIVKSCWYINLISASFAQLSIPGLKWELTPATLEELQEAFSDFLGDYSDIFDEILVTTRELFDIVDFDDLLESITLSWECRGIIRMFTWAGLIFLCWVLYQFMAKEWLFKIAIGSSKYKRSLPALLKIIVTGFTKIILGALLYVMQISVLLMFKVLVDSFGVLADVEKPAPCNDVDDFLWDYSPYLVFATAIMIVLWYILVFSGREVTWKYFYNYLLGIISMVLMLALFPIVLLVYLCKRDKNTLRRNADTIKGPFTIFETMVMAVKRIILLTFGIWTADTAGAFEIAGNAEKFDDDPDDDDNQQENVISIVGRSRGVLWIFVPGLVVLTKTSEELNNPPIFVLKSSNLELRTPLKRRVFKWVFNVTRLAITLIVVFSPVGYLVAGLIGTFIPGFILDLYFGIKEASHLDDIGVQPLPTDGVAPQSPALPANSVGDGVDVDGVEQGGEVPENKFLNVDDNMEVTSVQGDTDVESGAPEFGEGTQHEAETAPLPGSNVESEKTNT